MARHRLGWRLMVKVVPSPIPGAFTAVSHIALFPNRSQVFSRFPRDPGHQLSLEAPIQPREVQPQTPANAVLANAPCGTSEDAEGCGASRLGSKPSINWSLSWFRNVISDDLKYRLFYKGTLESRQIVYE